MILPIPFGRYVLVDKIATGGMAEIFLAKLFGAEGFEKKVVVKKILPAWSHDPEFVSMLIDEAKITVQLSHANIVQVHELIREDGILAIAMEFVEGLDLRRLMQRLGPGQPLDLDRALYIVSEVLSGLAYAHERAGEGGRALELVHRDVSPQNILLSRDGAVKITDFGIARAASRSHETVAGVLKGKFAYMSPEQASQEGLDQRSDLFSVAIILYELVTGERLFARGSDLETLDRVRRAVVTFSPEAEKKVPPPLREILLKALARDPGGRFQDATAFREALMAFARRAKRKPNSRRLTELLSSLFPQDPASSEQEVTRTFAPAKVLDETRDLISSPRLAKGSPHPERTSVIASPAVPKLRPSRAPLWLGLGGGGLFLALIAVTLLLIQGGEGPALSRVEGPEARPSPPAAVIGTPILAVSKTTPVAAQENYPQIDPAQVVPLGEGVGVAARPPPSHGFLNVQAIPWGYVTVAGLGPVETPIRRMRIVAGIHKLRVSYEPDGSELASEITIEGGNETTCIANFRDKDKKEIRCRP